MSPGPGKNSDRLQEETEPETPNRTCPGQCLSSDATPILLRVARNSRTTFKTPRRRSGRGIMMLRAGTGPSHEGAVDHPDNQTTPQALNIEQEQVLRFNLNLPSSEECEVSTAENSDARWKVPPTPEYYPLQIPSSSSRPLTPSSNPPHRYSPSPYFCRTGSGLNLKRRRRASCSDLPSNDLDTYAHADTPGKFCTPWKDLYAMNPNGRTTETASKRSRSVAWGSSDLEERTSLALTPPHSPASEPAHFSQGDEEEEDQWDLRSTGDTPPTLSQ